MALSFQRVAGDIHIPESLIDGIIKGKEIISADTALRLGKYFGNGPEFRLTLQMKYDISAAAECLSGELDGVLQLSDVPDVSLQEALNPLTEQQLLEQKISVMPGWKKTKIVILCERRCNFWNLLILFPRPIRSQPPQLPSAIWNS